MLLTGDWLSPRIYGTVWFDKPPLFYWLTAASYTLFGVTEWASRLPSVVLGTVLPLYLYFSLIRITGRKAAFASALILLTSPLYFYLAKAAVTDMTLTFALTAAMVTFWKKQYLPFYIFCGLAMLAKGPVGYAFPAFIILAHCAVTGKWRVLKDMHLFTWGAALALAVGLPWFIAMYNLHGDAFLQGFIGYNNIIRFVAPEHPGRNSWYFFIPVLLAGVLPWAGLLLETLASRKGLYQKDKPFYLYLHLWTWIIFLFFSFSRTQLVSYILPCLPPLSILMGCHLTRLFEEHALKARHAVFLIASNILLAGGIALYYDKLARYVPDLFFIPLLFLAAAVLSALSLLRKKPSLFLAVQTAGIICFAAFLFGVYGPHVEAPLSSRPASAILTRVYDGKSPLYIDPFLRPGTAFYSNLYGEAADFKKGHPFPEAPAYAVIRASWYDRLLREKRLPPHTELLSRQGQTAILHISPRSERSHS